MTAGTHAKPKPSRSVKRRPIDFLRRRVLELVTTLEALRDELIAKPKEPKALHEYRKQTRRVAAGYQLLELFLKPTAYANVQALTSVLSKGLGRWRDADVLDKRLRELGRGQSKAVQRTAHQAAQENRDRWPESARGQCLQKIIPRASAPANRGTPRAGPRPTCRSTGTTTQTFTPAGAVRSE